MVLDFSAVLWNVILAARGDPRKGGGCHLGFRAGHVACALLPRCRPPALGSLGSAPANFTRDTSFSMLPGWCDLP